MVNVLQAACWVVYIGGHLYAIASLCCFCFCCSTPSVFTTTANGLSARSYSSSSSSSSTTVADFLDRAARLQLFLQREQPLSKLALPDSHNSFNTRDPFRNQFHPISYQLELGVRHLELDLHFYKGKVALCHAFRESDIEEVPIGCQLNAVDFEAALATISRFLVGDPSHAEEFIILSLEDYIKEYPNVDPEAIDTIVNDAFDKYFGDALIFTPDNLLEWRRQANSNNNSNWPTLGELLAARKRVLISSPRDDHGGRFIHGEIMTYPYPDTKSKLFVPETCSHSVRGDLRNADFVRFYADRSRIQIFGLLIYDGPTEVGDIDARKASQIINCGFSPGMDQVDEALMLGTVWTFDSSSPIPDPYLLLNNNNNDNDNDNDNYSVLMSRSLDGHWVALAQGDVNGMLLPYACKHIGEPNSPPSPNPWRIMMTTTTTTTSHHDPNLLPKPIPISISYTELVSSAVDLQQQGRQRLLCPQGFALRLPNGPVDNRLLLAAMIAAGVDRVWLPYSLYTQQQQQQKEPEPEP